MEFTGFASTLFVNLSSMFYTPNNVNNGKISQRLAYFKNQHVVSNFVLVGNKYSVTASTRYSLKLQVGLNVLCIISGVMCIIVSLGKLSIGETML